MCKIKSGLKSKDWCCHIRLHLKEQFHTFKIHKLVLYGFSTIRCSSSKGLVVVMNGVSYIPSWAYFSTFNNS